jgi:hypothetical protein
LLIHSNGTWNDLSGRKGPATKSCELFPFNEKCTMCTRVYSSKVDIIEFF